MGNFARLRKRKTMKAIRAGERRAHKAAMVMRYDMAKSYAEQVRADRLCRRNTLSHITDIFMLTVHERYGFGRERILRLRDKMQSEFDAIVAGNVNIREIDLFLKKELRLDTGLCSRISTDHYESIEDKAVREMSAAFLMAMLDEFGYKGNALAKTCRHAFAINDKLKNNELTYPQIRERLQKIMDRGKKGNVCLDEKSRG